MSTRKRTGSDDLTGIAIPERWADAEISV